MDQTALEELARKFGLGEVLFQDSLPSTNTLALEWAERDCPNNSLIVADEQTRGKGRSGRQWHTIAGSSLALSFILNEFGGLSEPSHFVGLSALASALALEEFTKRNISIKWPNDILIDRKKVAGILVESRWEGDSLKSVILGVGINLTPNSLSFPEPPRVPSTYLQAHTRNNFTQIDILDSIINQILKWTQISRPEAIFSAWNQRLAYLGEKIQATRNVNDQVEGVLLGVSDSGELVLRLSDRTIMQYSANEIRAISPNLKKDAP